MKRLVKLTAFVIMAFCAMNLNAQSKLKFGHINSDSLLKLMPGRDSAYAKIQNEVKTYQTQYQAMQTEYDTKTQDYQTNLATMSPIIKSTKEAEIQDLQSRMQKFQTSAQEALQKKQTELLQPIIDKAKKAIEAVGKEEGFTYIFDSALGSLLYLGGGEDIMPFVKKKLNIK